MRGHRCALRRRIPLPSESIVAAAGFVQKRRSPALFDAKRATRRGLTLKQGLPEWEAFDLSRIYSELIDLIRSQQG
jgi:hypothetical protein